MRQATRQAVRSVVESLEQRAYMTVSFGTPRPFGVEAFDVGVLQSPVAGDFNKDGRTDLIVVDAVDPTATGAASINGRLAFARGGGDGAFERNNSFSGGVFTSEARAGDFDGDGNLDLVVANSLGNNINVLLGNGNGTFRAPISAAVGQEPLALAVADFNGDGRADVAVGNRTGNSVTVLFGANSNTAPVGSPATLTAGTDPASLATGDFTGDGKVDLLVGTAGNPAQSVPAVLTVFPGTGTGPGGDATFGAAVNTSGPPGVTGVGDFNKDGRLDVAVSVSEAGVPTVLPGNGDGTFQVSSVPVGGLIALVADYDADGNLDVVAGGVPVQNTDNTTALAAAGNGNGTFQAAQTVAANQPGSGTVADFNGDGRPDLAFAGLSGSGRLIDVLLNTSNSGPGPTPTGADLTATVTGKLPPAVVGGTGKGRATVRVTNGGTDLVNGQVAITLFASPDGTLESGDAQLATTTKRMKLRPSKSKSFRIRFNFPASVPDGSYTILAQVDSANAVGEANEGNNVGSLATPVTIAAPFVDLETTFAAQPAATIARGSRQAVTVQVANKGNVPANGPVAVRLVASTTNAAGGQETELTTLNRTVRLGAGKSSRVRLTYTVPDALSGSRFLIASTAAASPLTETNAANNTAATTGQVTIA
jgi:hypothetical protein